MKLSLHKSSVRNFFAVFACAFAVFSFVQDAGAIIDSSLQLQLGNPSNAITDPGNTNHYLIQRTVEAIDYNAAFGLPNWASWDLTASDLGTNNRSSTFFTDTNLPPNFYRVTHDDYTHSGFDRGHMCPSADRTDTELDNDLVFYMSNIIPQSSVNNSGVWGTFEGFCRTLVQSTNDYELLIICGPSGFSGARINTNGPVFIPDYTWKIAVVVAPGAGAASSRITVSNRVIALKIPNTDDATNKWPSYVTSASQIETDTGLTFFTALPATVASALRGKVDGETNPPPVIANFSPASGKVNTNVVITGTNFNSTLSVTFNGTNAVFIVNSPTQITATVPANATSGLISITTPTGTANSSSSFTVNSSVDNVDLALTVTHVGNFVQGDTNDTYTITVNNVGTLAATGTVSVATILPAGLAATAIGGSGWTANLGTLTCTRADTLAAGASFPPISVTVNVAANAPASVTNIATVSVSGDANTLNNTSSDPTTILPSGSGNVGYTGTIAGWDMSGQTDYGISPLPPSITAPDVSVAGLTRGSGVGTSGTGAARAWGGVAFTNVSSATAIATNQFVTFSVAANGGYQVSFTAVSKLDYRRSGTGANNGVLQYQVGAGPFIDITNLSYTATTSSGGSIGAINLSGIAALQNVGAGTNVTFRIVNFGGTSSGGTWYIFDVAGNSAPDLAVVGSVTPAVILTPIEAWREQWFGTSVNLGIAADNYIGTSDGLPNLLKYALGLNPLLATNTPIVGDITTGYLRISTPKNPNATDVTMTAEVSSDLLTWTTNGMVVDQNTSTFFQAHDNVPVANGTNRFIRLRVTNP